jgi:hypothetical protein
MTSRKHVGECARVRGGGRGECSCSDLTRSLTRPLHPSPLLGQRRIQQARGKKSEPRDKFLAGLRAFTPVMFVQVTSCFY